MSKSFSELGLCKELCDACDTLRYKEPTEIQLESIPHALEGRDIIGLANTGSGKTAAFALPSLQHILNNPSGLACCVLTPTRELAFQIAESFESLGTNIGARCAVIVGGVDMVDQAIALSKKPHVIVATPGRLVDHLKHTKGFNLKGLKILIMDEADRILNLDFGKELDIILKVIPEKRQTLLFSATMTDKVEKLQKASLRNPVKVHVSTKYSTVDKLIQNYIFLPFSYKECYLAYLMNEIAGNSCIVFTATCSATQRLTLMLRELGFPAVALHGQMPQPKRLGALAKFSSGSRSILLATDVASRGLDLPCVDYVINYDLPTSSKTYVHRVGRTARAGRSGKSVTFVSQYDVEMFQRLENLLGKKMEAFPVEKQKALALLDRVSEANRIANMEMEEHKDKKTRKSKR